MKLCVSCDPYGRRPPFACKFRNVIASFLPAPFYTSIVPLFCPFVGEPKGNQKTTNGKLKGNQKVAFLFHGKKKLRLLGAFLG